VHTDHQPAIAYRDGRPNGIEQGGFGDQLARMVQQIAQHREGFGPQGNCL
jgi:hypothetical protein